MTTVLALLGSPRPDGNNGRAMEAVLRGAAAAGKLEVRKMLLNQLTIKPCQGCHRCLHTGRCVIRDDMDAVYDGLLTMDAFLLAAPIYFSGLSAQAKAMIDRCQPFWAARFARKTDLFSGRKRPGLLILTGGQPAYGGQFSGSQAVVKLLYKMIGVQSVGDFLAADIEARPMAQRPADLAELFSLGQRLNRDGASAVE